MRPTDDDDDDDDADEYTHSNRRVGGAPRRIASRGRQLIATRSVDSIRNAKKYLGTYFIFESPI